MSRNIKREVDISVKLNEPLTSDACSKLITELIKYLLYQKQQIPFSCECLAHLQAKAKLTDRNSSSMKAVLSSLRNVSDHLTSQLHLEGCNVKEIVVAMGATIVSPKFCVRIELPSLILSSRKHMEYQHSSRESMLRLMRSMIENTEFQDALTLPLGPTNTFVLLQKSDCNLISEFFLPKPQYVLPTQVTNRLSIKLDNTEKKEINCSCADLVKVYHDSANKDLVHNRSFTSSVQSVELSKSKDCINEAPYQWYLSKEIIKGFKYLR